VPMFAAWGYILLWPVLIVLAFALSLWRGPQSAVDMWLMVGGLAVEMILALVGLQLADPNCVLLPTTLLISNHVGNIVTSASFAVACLVAYLTWSGPTLASWISSEADETLRHFGLAQGGSYLYKDSVVKSHARQTFDACLNLPLTAKAVNRLEKSRGQGKKDLIEEIEEKKKQWREVAGYLKLGSFKRRMIEGRGDRWIAAGAIWMMVFVTGQALVLFLAEVMVGDRRIACWLSLGKPFFNDLPIEVGYGVAFLGIVTGVGLFRFRNLIQTLLEAHLAEQADDLSLQLLKEPAIDAIGRAGPA
jgi:hypothetical protein